MQINESWHQNEQHNLTLITQWIHYRLLALMANLDSEMERPNEVMGQQMAQQIAQLKTIQPLPKVVELRHLFQLSAFEEQIIWLCMAVELSPRLGMLCAAAQQNAEFTYPTFALAMTLFGETDWQAFAPNSPLRYWHLVNINRIAQRSLITCPLQIDERLIYYLQGFQLNDIRLEAYFLPLSDVAPSITLPPSQQRSINSGVAYIQEQHHESPLIQLVGIDSVSKYGVAGRIAKAVGVTLYHLQIHLIPPQVNEFMDWVRLWNREQRLAPLALYLGMQAFENENGFSKATHRLVHFLHHIEGLCFIDSQSPLKSLSQRHLILEIGKPTSSEQIESWQERLATPSQDIPIQLAAQFNFNLPTIDTIGQGAKGTLSQSTALNKTALWERALVYSRAEIDELAQRIIPKATWDDIVLPDEQRQLLQLIAKQVRHQGTIYEQWGFRKKLSRGLGMTVLFAGESGTGKTMAAEILANHLNLNLYRIDLSGVVSKYIGDTEKNLRKLFDAADEGGMILFFDEADALFGKRSEVRSSHDRYANIEVNYLLQRIEAFQGLAILATNFKSSLDDAFMRRIRFAISFSKPKPTQREQIWRKVFPPETPLGPLDFTHLAKKFDLTGGSIANIALNAAFIAHGDHAAVSMQHVLNATRIELIKKNRLVNQSDFRWKGTSS